MDQMSYKKSETFDIQEIQFAEKNFWSNCQILHSDNTPEHINWAKEVC